MSGIAPWMLAVAVIMTAIVSSMSTYIAIIFYSQYKIRRQLSSPVFNLPQDSERTPNECSKIDRSIGDFNSMINYDPNSSQSKLNTDNAT